MVFFSSSSLRVTNSAQGTVLVEEGRVADNVWTRLKGLLAEHDLLPGEGLWILPCNSIHSIGMRFRFDALFLDRHYRVVHTMAAMPPWRVSRIVWQAASVLELPAGTISATGTSLGDLLKMERMPPKPGRGAG